jgi:hypothetical protein
MRFLMMLLMLVSFSHAESVKVFVLNGKNGRPLSGASVSVQFFYDNPAKVTTPLSLETSPEGSVDFGLPSPLPNHIGLQVSLKYYACECGMMADTKSIVQEGKLVIFRGQKVKSGITPKPGQITFVPLPFTFIQRLLYPLVKY